MSLSSSSLSSKAIEVLQSNSESLKQRLWRIGIFVDLDLPDHKNGKK